MGGLFGVIANENCSKTLFYGTDFHSHLGTENAGMAVFGTKGFYKSIHSISQAQFKSRFVDDYKVMDGQIGIGVIDDDSPQPLIFRSKFGTFAIAATGLIANYESLTNQLMDEGISFSERTGGKVNSVELAAKLINKGKNIVDGIRKMQDAIEGSLCILIMTEAGIYAARDKFGRFPLSIGRGINNRESLVVATEASSFPNLGFELVEFIGPGEVKFLTNAGEIETKAPALPVRKTCAFLWIYTGYPSSIYDGVSVESARERCGAALARNDHVEADFVAGIPDSGVGHALGYAMASGLPFRRPLVKYTPGYGRSYTPPSQDIRNLVATMKLSAIRDVIAGSRMVICDDSIVRGTQLKNFTVKKLWDNGAKEIHIRPACPPLIFPCKYGSSTRSISELAARRAIRAIEGKDIGDVSEYLDSRSKKYAEMVEWIRRDINVTSLMYLDIKEMVKAIGIPEEQLCLYCWRGEDSEK
ncbi:MAG TPA: amidophosphoribosyltransferase [Syntrophales bacterium]|jgi:amidophosphoribosyltransferase|nr:amidophosphoribosyltransferase [Syntrophales bacterium]HPX54967.1 amidophosphoribosyltransferase [Syntrophales bacterium]HQA82568.1 amidophosphoribosyltransferase [Syntrophales bacterium]